MGQQHESNHRRRLSRDVRATAAEMAIACAAAVAVVTTRQPEVAATLPAEQGWPGKGGTHHVHDPIAGRMPCCGLQAIPEAAPALADLRVGTLTPVSPVLITSGRNDDTVPYNQARQLAEDWCAKGATVEFRTNELPPLLPGTTISNHFGPEIIDGFGPDNAITYLLDRLAGKPVSGCVID